MPPTLRALLERVIDYAGLFPPAKLSMAEAVRNYLAYRDSPQSWMLGGFVCGASQLGDLAQALSVAKAAADIPCCVIASPADSIAAAAKTLRGDLARMKDFVAAFPNSVESSVWQSLEFRLPPDCAPDRSGIPMLLDEINRAATDLEVPVATVYLEAPLNEHVVAVAQSVSSFLWRTNGAFGLKFRTGGLDAAAYPSSEGLAHGMAACRDQGLVYKLTAGLHQPLRHEEQALVTESISSCTMAHGFLNVLVAAVLATTHRELPQREMRAILEEQSAESFAFSATTLRWRDYTAALEQIRSARQASLISLGSCSFDEPLEGLRDLGWLAAGRQR
jgi:hypothetical protein